MFASFSNMLPSLSLPGGDKDGQTPTNAATTNPFDRLLAVKRRFDGSRTPMPAPAEPASGATTPGAVDTDVETDEQRAAAAAAVEKERRKKPLNEVRGACP